MVHEVALGCPLGHIQGPSHNVHIITAPGKCLHKALKSCPVVSALQGTNSIRAVLPCTIWHAVRSYNCRWDVLQRRSIYAQSLVCMKRLQLVQKGTEVVTATNVLVSSFSHGQSSLQQQQQTADINRGVQTSSRSSSPVEALPNLG